MTQATRKPGGGRGAAAGAAATLLAALQTGCAGPQSMLDAAGPGAAAIARLWWVLFAVTAVVFLATMAALAYAVLRRRAGPRPPGDPRAERRTVTAVIVAGAVVPGLILIGILVYTLEVLDAVGPAAHGDDELTVQVVGKQFWWEIRYPLEDGDTVVTANELHIPVGRRVRLLLESDNVIHSVWIPALHGKADMTPGRTSRMWLRADRPGVYRGQCAEYCGVQHTWMKMLVVAQPGPEFGRWLDHQRRPAAVAAGAAAGAAAGTAAGPGGVRGVPRGREIFLSPEARCAECHAIRGLVERSGSPGERPVDGPDLTHVASRRTIAAGLLPATRGNMAGWVANPQVLKPGNFMPRIPLPPDDLNALLEFLMSLE